jgi:hypothetical protein
MNKTDTSKINGAGPQLPKKDSSPTPVFTRLEPQLPPSAAKLPDSPPSSGPAPQKPKAAAIVVPEKKRS